MQFGQGKDRQNGQGLCVLKFVPVFGRWELTEHITQLGQGKERINGRERRILKFAPAL